MKGRSDQAGCRSIHCVRGAVSLANRPSSAKNTAPTPALISPTRSAMSEHTRVWSFALLSSSADAGPSRPIGAKTSTRWSRSTSIALVHVGDVRAGEARIAREDAAELRERRAELDPCAAQAKLANTVL